jgi:hypothetical protein
MTSEVKPGLRSIKTAQSLTRYAKPRSVMLG